MQAELVDGFLAWDFDADTAATFFAQQVYHTGSRKSVIREYGKRCYIPSVLTCVYSLTYSRPVLHLLSSSRSTEHAHPAARGRALREKAVLPLRLYAPAGIRRGMGQRVWVRQTSCGRDRVVWTVFVVIPSKAVIPHSPKGKERRKRLHIPHRAGHHSPAFCFTLHFASEVRK